MLVHKPIQIKETHRSRFGWGVSPFSLSPHLQCESFAKLGVVCKTTPRAVIVLLETQ